MRARQSGYSILELVVVAAIVAIMSTVAVFSLPRALKAESADTAGKQILDFIRDASELALMSTVVHRLDLTPSTSTTVGTIAIVRTSDNKIIRQETLSVYTDVVIARPTTPSFTATPPSPFDFSDAAFTSGKWSVLFNGNGSVTSVTTPTAPISCVLYLYNPAAGSPTQPESSNTIRAISIFGPTGAIRFWGYFNNAFARR